jgi:hypothetical protein
MRRRLLLKDGGGSSVIQEEEDSADETKVEAHSSQLSSSRQGDSETNTLTLRKIHAALNHFLTQPSKTPSEAGDLFADIVSGEESLVEVSQPPCFLERWSRTTLVWHLFCAYWISCFTPGLCLYLLLTGQEANGRKQGDSPSGWLSRRGCR